MGGKAGQGPTQMGKKKIDSKGKNISAVSDERFKAAAAERVKNILPILKKTYPDAKVALKFTNPFELLVATILSAQCTDVRVNMVTKEVFKKYKTAADWANADKSEIEQDIRSTGFYHNKAANIKNTSREILERFGGKIPETIDELVTLPGVGRKTANVVIGGAFGKPAITCDTHVIRLSRRLGLSKNSDAVKLEFDLAEIVLKKDWMLFSNCLIFHGRNICFARRPACQNCPIARFCPAANKPELW
jgi:endonuclease III